MKKTIKTLYILSIALILSVFLVGCQNNVHNKEFKISIISENREICNVTFDTRDEKLTTSKITTGIKENSDQMCKVEGNVDTGFKITLHPTSTNNNSNTLE